MQFLGERHRRFRNSMTAIEHAEPEPAAEFAIDIIAAASRTTSIVRPETPAAQLMFFLSATLLARSACTGKAAALDGRQAIAGVFGAIISQNQRFPTAGQNSMKTDRVPYETSRWSAGQPEQAKRCLDELEMGPQNVRARLGQTDTGSSDAFSIGSIRMTIGFAQEWLAWHDRRRETLEASRHNRQVFWTRFAALAATSRRSKKA